MIGTWWFVTEEANSCCSKAIGDSFWRATTYSFGSICLGSFLVALVQALRALEYYTRDQDDCQFLSCIIQCLLSCIQGILEEINKWAYVYVGYVLSHVRTRGRASLLHQLTFATLQSLWIRFLGSWPQRHSVVRAQRLVCHHYR